MLNYESTRTLPAIAVALVSIIASLLLSVMEPSGLLGIRIHHVGPSFLTSFITCSKYSFISSSVREDSIPSIEVTFLYIS